MVFPVFFGFPCANIPLGPPGPPGRFLVFSFAICHHSLLHLRGKDFLIFRASFHKIFMVTFCNDFAAAQNQNLICIPNRADTLRDDELRTAEYDTELSSKIMIFGF